MFYEYWNEGVKFIVVFLIVMTIPCVFVTLIGYRMINRLGQYPSKTPDIQVGVCLKLVLIELVSFALIYLFYHILATDIDVRVEKPHPPISGKE